MRANLKQISLKVPVNRTTLRKKNFTIVVSSFNQPLTEKLLHGARKCLIYHGVSAARIRVVWVAGCFELPFAAMKAVATKPKADGVIALGVVIKGETIQYKVLANAVFHGLIRASMDSGVPVSCGVVVASNLQQAQSRAGGKAGNRGEEAALAVLSLI